MADDANRMMLESQRLKHAAGDQTGLAKEGAFLRMLPRLPDPKGDHILGVGSRANWQDKQMPGAVLGVFGSQMAPNRMEMFMGKLHDQLKEQASAADQARAGAHASGGGGGGSASDGGASSSSSDNSTSNLGRSLQESGVAMVHMDANHDPFFGVGPIGETWSKHVKGSTGKGGGRSGGGGGGLLD